MITNIIDRRTNSHKWHKVDAIIEPVHHDNSVKGADKAPVPSKNAPGGRPGDVYNEVEGISVSGAIGWANSCGYPVTLYLYDIGTLRG